MSFLIIGAGSWGTAFAVHTARLYANTETKIYLSGRDEAQMVCLQEKRENKHYLPGIILPENLSVINNAEIKNIVLNNNNINIIIAVPSLVFRETLLQLKSCFSVKTQKLIWITKGLDAGTHDFLHKTAKEILGEELLFGILSGPSFANEIALGLPAAVTLASLQPEHQHWINLFHTAKFRVYFSTDIIGVQLGGAVKNVLAIAVGITEGLGCGANAQAALITRGLAEMMRLGIACGARPETLMGLSGAGDLILTCTSNQSRNRRFGMALAQNKTRLEAEQSIGQVVEGIQAAKEIYALSQQYSHLEMPITTQVYKLLYENLSPVQALNNILMREPKIENL